MPKQLILRDLQLEAIEDIKSAYNNGFKNVVLKAPTGSGKSIIGLEVSRQLDMESHVLTNEFFLQQQYLETVKDYGYDADIIASAHQYTCKANQQNVKTLAECKLAGLSLSKAWNQASCAKSCDFMINRFMTPFRQSIITNYAYYLKMMNYAFRQKGIGKNQAGMNRHELQTATYNGPPPIIPRKLVIADEAHKLGEATQNYFSFTIDMRLALMLKEKQDALRTTGIWMPGLRLQWGALAKLINAMLKIKFDDVDGHLNALESIKGWFINMREASLETKQFVSMKWGGSIEDGKIVNSTMPNEVRELLALDAVYEETFCRIDDYLQLINGDGKLGNNLDGKQNFVISYEGRQGRGYKFYDEAALCQHTFHPWSENRLFMSATIGDPEAFIKRFGLNASETKILEVDPQWNYDKSKIVLMASTDFRHANTGLAQAEMIPDINLILQRHINDAGIIHTTTYENAAAIKKQTNTNRLILYKNAAEKRVLVKQLKTGQLPHNSVMVGPSIAEGVDMPGELCRFQILLKVPFPYLGDRLWAKRNYSKDRWIYRSHAIFSIIQAIGRGVRYDGDYCTTYLLDKRFDVYLRSMWKYLPKDMAKRLIKRTPFLQQYAIAA